MRAAFLALTAALATIGCAGHGGEPASTTWDPEAARLFDAAEKAIDAGDYAQGRALMERAAATGEPDAVNALATLVGNGIGGDPDPVRARALLEQAVAAGSIGAKLNLGLDLIDSEDPAEQARAVELLDELHAHPPDDAGKDAVRMAAAGGLARAYLFGLGGVKENVTRGVDLLEEADHGHEAEAEVLYLLGRTFQSGWGGREPDALRSYLYFMRGAQEGHAPSQWYVGMALLNESGAEHDEREAYRWVRKSGEGGFVNGEISTAVMLALGQGVLEDDVQARTWYERAARKNSAHALRGLGLMLLTGEGGPRDAARGLAYVQLATDGGDENAAKALPQFESQLSDADRAAADQIAAQWLLEHGTPND